MRMQWSRHRVRCQHWSVFGMYFECVKVKNLRDILN